MLKKTQKEEPNRKELPAIGYRETYFTLIANTNLRHPRKELPDYSIHLQPPIIEDYELNTVYEQLVTIRNTSKRMKYITVSNTTTKEFQLSKNTRLGEMAIAPGFEKQIVVLFKASTYQTLQDKLEFLVRDGKPLCVMLQAIPPACIVEHDATVEFGTMLLSDCWVSKQIKLRNPGKRDVKVQLESDGAVKLFTSCVTIPSNSDFQMTLEYLPKQEGVLNTFVKVIVLNDTPVEQSKFQLTGKVISNMFSLRTENNELLGSTFDFGTVVFGQKANLLATMINQGKEGYFWKLADANSKWNTGNLKPLAEISMEPDQGYLGAGETIPIAIRFTPKASIKTQGFLKTISVPSPLDYHRSLHLSVLTNAGNLASQSAVTLRGRGAPLDLEWSSKTIHFQSITFGSEISRPFSIKNKSEISLRFEFQSTAHFRISPKHGVLERGNICEFTAEFRPNQLGLFQHHVKCIFFGLKKSADSSLESDQAGEEEILLVGTSLPPKGTPSHTGRPEKGVSSAMLNPNWSKHVAHRKKYIDYIRSLKKVHRDPKIKCLDNEIDLDSRIDAELHRHTDPDSGNGLLPPEPLKNVPLEQLEQGRQSNGIDPVMAEALFERLKVPTAHRPQPIEPTSHPQDWQYHPLSSDQLQQVHVSVEVIDFGETTIYSSKKVVVNFLNMNRVPLNLAFSILNDSPIRSRLSLSDNSIQLPFLGLGGIELCLSGELEGEFRGVLQYTINKRYNRSIPIRGKLTPISLKCSLTNLEITASSYGLEQDLIRVANEGSKPFTNKAYLEEEVKAAPQLSHSNTKIPYGMADLYLTNPGETEAFYEIGNASSGILNPEIFHVCSESLVGAFHCSIRHGKLSPKEKVKLNITYVPGTRPVSEHTLSIRVYAMIGTTKTHVQTIEVNLKGVGPSSSCIISPSPSKQHPLDFGVLPIPEPMSLKDNSQLPVLFGKLQGSRKVVKIKNSVGTCAFHSFVSSSDGDIEISPSCGIIMDSQTFEITVTVNPKTSGVKEEFVIINTYGAGKSFRIPVRFEGKLPKMELSKLESGFSEKVHVGSVCSESYLLVNRGEVHNKTIFDFSDMKEFRIELRDERKCASSRGRSAAATVSRLSTKRSTPPISGNEREKQNKTLEMVLAGESRYYALDCGPGEKIHFDILFEPSKPKKHQFYVPMYGLGDYANERNRGLTKLSVDLEAVESPLSLSHTSIFFKDKIIPRNEPKTFTEEVSHFYLQLNNCSTENIEWSAVVHLLEGESEVFKLEGKRTGILKPNEPIDLDLQFLPLYAGNFQARLSFTIEHCAVKSMFRIPLEGTASNPTLLFDPPELFLPVIPPGETFTAFFRIINKSCDVGEIEPVIPEENCIVPGSLGISFVNGNCLRDHNDTLSCVLKFAANKNAKSGSFTLKFPMQTSDGVRFYFTINGGVDSSVFSLQPYVFELTKAPPKKPCFRTPAGLNIENSANVADAYTLYSRLGETALFWLKDFIDELHGLKNHGYPEKLALSQGKPIVNIMNALCGKKPQEINGKGHGNTIDNVQDVYNHYRDLLVFLSSHGAVLNSVKPELLLSVSEYNSLLNLLKKKNSKGSWIEIKQRLQYYLSAPVPNVHELLRVEAWSQLLLQVFRVFYVPTQISTQSHKIKTLNCPPEHMKSADFPLFEWCSTQVGKVIGQKPSLEKFDTIFNDGMIFKNIILSYMPHLATHFNQCRFGRSNDTTGRVSNAKTLKEVLILLFGDEMFENFNTKWISDGLGIDHAFLTLHLYLTLPSYAPKLTIDFSSNLHEKSTREIEVTNNLSIPVAYTAQIIGDDEFSLKEEQFLVSPKGTYRLEIGFLSRFWRQANAMLFVRSKRSSFGSSTILAFKLTAEVTFPVSIPLYKVEAPVYSNPPATLCIPILNPFSVDANFQIKVTQKLVSYFN